jgi:hypothetical protein
MIRAIYSVTVLVMALLGLCCGRIEQNKASEIESCRKFAQDFYDWYLNHSGTDGAVIKERPELFAPELLELLKKNEEYEPPSLEFAFDASYFTLTQENATTYEVGTPQRTGSDYRIPVYGIREGVKSTEPEFWAEVRHTKGGWQFVNFHDLIDGKPNNLVRNLRELQIVRSQANRK